MWREGEGKINNARSKNIRLINSTHGLKQGYYNGKELLRRLRSPTP